MISIVSEDLFARYEFRVKRRVKILNKKIEKFSKRILRFFLILRRSGIFRDRVPKPSKGVSLFFLFLN